MDRSNDGDAHPGLTTRHVYDCNRCGNTFQDYHTAKDHTENRCPAIADPHEVTVAELPGTARALVLTPTSNTAHLYADCPHARRTDRIVAPINQLEEACSRVVERRVTPEGLEWCDECLDRYVKDD